jgi:hypothetical protein
VPVNRVRDTISETEGNRLTVHKDKDTTYFDYSNGAEVIVEKTQDGTPGKLREVRTITKTRGPRKYFYAK